MIIIPARLASTRFPQKVLAPINGVPMVVATARRVADVDEVCIATDSEEVVRIAAQYGVEAVLTRADHQSGTDRIDEAATLLGLSEEALVVNVQADEPFIEPVIVERVFAELASLDRPFVMASCYKAITPDQAKDPNLVKVILDDNGDAIYFSRSVIPYDRDGGFDAYKGHIGIYGFRRDALRTFCRLPHAPLEHIEKLEQLRALYFGRKIAMVGVETASFGIDTREDYERALALHG